MKYIKTYENLTLFENSKPKCWCVRTDSPYFKISLEKIGVPEREINNWLENTNIQNYKELAILYNKQWQHVPFELLDLDEVNYQGEIQIEDFEIDANKYNL